jgi:hypothetical protein
VTAFHGSAVVLAGEDSYPVDVALTARLEPVDGKYHWGGRIAVSPGVVALVRSGTRQVALVIGDGAPAEARLGEPDLWGGVRITGTGHPPWPPDPFRPPPTS